MAEHRPELYTEVKAFENSQERERLDNNAEVYSIVKTIQTLEKAYSKDYIRPEQYTPACQRLLSQFKVAFRLVQHEFKSLDKFIQFYKMEDCYAAIDRIKEDRPITIRDDGQSKQKTTMEITTCLMTLMDSLELQQWEVKELLPNLRLLTANFDRFSALPRTFEGGRKMKEWQKKLQEQLSENISDTLDEDTVTRFKYEIQACYDEFRDVLENL